jgi:hypothetical protein
MSKKSSKKSSKKTSKKTSKKLLKQDNKPMLYNDLHPSKSLKNTGFKNKFVAINTIRLIKNRSLKYQFDLINTMYNRAKYHPNKTNEMAEAMKIFKIWLDKYKNKKQKENLKYPWLKLNQKNIDQYKKLLKKYKNVVLSVVHKKFLSVLKNLNYKYYKLQYIPINYIKDNFLQKNFKQNNFVGFDYWSYRIFMIKSILNDIKKNKTPLYYNDNMPTEQHIVLILLGYSPDKKLYGLTK